MSQVPPPNPYQAAGFDPYQQMAWDPNDPAVRDFALTQVAAPAVALMAMAILFGLMAMCGVVLQVIALSVDAAANRPAGPFDPAVFNIINIAGSSVGIVGACVIFLGGLKMKSLENYGLSMAAAIVSFIPCVSPCCLLGLPIGIWALVVLNRPEVKAAFTS